MILSVKGVPPPLTPSLTDEIRKVVFDSFFILFNDTGISQSIGGRSAEGLSLDTRAALKKEDEKNDHLKVALCT